MIQDTIFALSTIFGKSGVAVIRVSGTSSKQLLAHFKIKKDVQKRIATLVTLLDEENYPIDKILLLYFCAPYSFTGEDVIELHTHGSTAVINTILYELSKIFRIAEPGEFSRRAFYNNKLDLTQAEGLSDLIDAETKMQARQAMRQMSGELHNLYHNWRQQLITVMAEMEAYIDFPDEDIPVDTSSRVQCKVNVIIDAMNDHLQDQRRGERLRDGFHVSVIGPPNVGKSTLFNYFAKQDIAIVSDISGTTRDVLEVKIDLDGYPVIFSDTAGIRDSLDPIEIEGIIRAKKCAKQSDMTIVLLAIDQLHYDVSSDIQNLINKNALFIASKADHLPEDVEVVISDKKLLPISVHKNLGLSKLMKRIKTVLKSQLASSEVPVITRERHRQAITLAQEHLKRYTDQDNLVLAMEDLRMAAQSIGQITGDIKVDDILDQLFGTFCIGK